MPQPDKFPILKPTLRHIRADIYQLSGNCQEALKDIKIPISSPVYSLPAQIDKTHRSYAKIFMCLGQLDSAIAYFSKALVSNDTLFLASIHEGLSTAYARKNQPLLALKHKNLGVDMQNRVLNLQKSKELALLMYKKEVEQELKNVEDREGRRRLWLIISFLAVVLALVVSLSFLMRYRHRQKMLLQEKDLLEMREILNAQALQKAEATVVAQNKEIGEIKQQLDFKNEIIETLKISLDKAAHTPDLAVIDTENAAQGNSKSDEIAQSGTPLASNNEILRNIRILTKEDWRQFRELYDKRYPQFSSQLKTRLPNLTPAETRLFLLIRTGFDSTEIGHALGISSSSVYISRHRLRKKLELLEEEDLEKWISAF